MIRRFCLLSLSAVLFAACDALDDVSPPEPRTEVELTAADVGALEALAGCDVYPAKLGVRVTGRLTDASCEFGSVNANLSVGDNPDAKVQFVGFRIDDQATVRVRMTSSEVDSYLGLYHKGGRRIVSGRDNGGGIDAEIEITLSPGTYLIVSAATRAEERGAFETLIQRAGQ